MPTFLATFFLPHRPLAFVHMVAHYLQHLFEESKLPILGAAWDAWDLDMSAIRELAGKTCTVEGLEFSLGMVAGRGWTHRLNPGEPRGQLHHRDEPAGSPGMRRWS